MTATVPRPDYWSRWFFRLVQVVGVAIAVHEVLGAGRPFVLLFAGALILGAVGVKTLVMGIAELADAAAKEAEKENKPHG